MDQKLGKQDYKLDKKLKYPFDGRSSVSTTMLLGADTRPSHLKSKGWNLVACGSQGFGWASQ